jgi:hypothetical protein
LLAGPAHYYYGNKTNLNGARQPGSPGYAASPDTLTHAKLRKQFAIRPLATACGCCTTCPLSGSYVLTSKGLELTYWMGGLSSNYAGSSHDVVLIPYAELRPLVRPGTPLARMLWARGLW